MPSSAASFARLWVKPTTNLDAASIGTQAHPRKRQPVSITDWGRARPSAAGKFPRPHWSTRGSSASSRRRSTSSGSAIRAIASSVHMSPTISPSSASPMSRRPTSAAGARFPGSTNTIWFKARPSRRIGWRFASRISFCARRKPSSGSRISWATSSPASLFARTRWGDGSQTPACTISTSSNRHCAPTATTCHRRPPEGVR